MHLEALKPVFEHAGPFVTVHAEVGRTSESALDELDARCNTVRRDLERHGVDAALVDEVDRRLREEVHLPGDATRTLVAADGEILLDEVRMGSTPADLLVEVGPLPEVGAWLSVSDGELPFMVVVADREGADVDLYLAAGREAVHHDEMHGNTEHIQKVHEGGWAQKRYQRRTENVWRGNAEMVAEEIRSLYRQSHPRLIVLAGDVRARAHLADLLEGLPVEQVESGGRGAGASADALWDDVERLLAEHVAHDEADLMETLDRGAARGVGVVQGLDEVLDALVRAEVDRLVLDLRRAHDLTVRPADHPGLPVPAAAQDAELPADEVLVAAAALTGAEVSLLPAEQGRGGGVAAVLRWDDRAERPEDDG
jgi:hypothetical protein